MAVCVAAVGCCGYVDMWIGSPAPSDIKPFFSTGFGCVPPLNP